MVKLYPDRDMAVLKLTKAELERATEGADITLEVSGVNAEAEVLGVSGRSAKVKVLFGMEKLSEGQEVGIRSGHKKGREKAQATETAAPEAAEDGDGGNRTKPSPFAPEWRQPWALRGAEPLNPAQMTRIGKYGGLISLGTTDGKLKMSGGDNKSVIDQSSKTVGLTGGGHLHAGVRVGLTFLQQEDEYKTTRTVSSGSGTTDSTGKFKMSSEMTAAAIAAPVNRQVVLGGEFAQISVKVKPDGGGSSSVSYSVFRPGVVYHTKSLEVGFRYAPPIDIREKSGESAQSPRLLRLHGQFRLGAGQYAGGVVEHVHASGLDDDRTDFVMAMAGGESRTDWGGFGGFLSHKTKSYRNKENASPLSIPLVGLTLLTDFTINKAAAADLMLGYTMGSAKADTGMDNDSKTKITSNLLDLTISCRYLL